MQENGVWRTVRGRRIFIANGDDLYTAMEKSGKFKNLGKRGTYQASKNAKNQTNEERIKGGRSNKESYDERNKEYGLDRQEIEEELLSNNRELYKPKHNEEEANRRRKKEYKNNKTPKQKARDIDDANSSVDSSISALNEIDRLAGDDEKLQKLGREMGAKEFKQFLKDNPWLLKRKNKK